MCLQDFHKRCFLNGVFQSGTFKRVVRIRKGRRHQIAWKDWCFQACFVPLKKFASVVSWGEESEKHRLENTVWNPWGLGGVQTYRTLEGGGELAPKVVLGKLALLTFKFRIFT